MQRFEFPLGIHGRTRFVRENPEKRPMWPGPNMRDPQTYLFVCRLIGLDTFCKISQYVIPMSFTVSICTLENIYDPLKERYSDKITLSVNTESVK